MKQKSENIFILNKTLTEEELTSIFSQSRYVLFTYKHDSVLSSAALCKTLAYGKEVIGPNVGSFKELGKKNLLFTYDSFSALETFFNCSKSGNFKIDQNALSNYIHETSWPAFTDFLTENISNLYIRRAFNFQ